MVLWFTLLQLVLGYLSGALGSHQEVLKRRSTVGSLHSQAAKHWQPVSSIETMSFRAQKPSIPSLDSSFEVFKPCKLRYEIELNAHAGSVLLGHAAGFAAVNMWSILQQAVPRNFFCCLAMPMISFFGISLIYQLTERVRHWKTMADGEEDEFETLWGDRVAETEDEVISLTVSFLLVQVLRFCISGHLPDESGEDKMRHSNWSVFLLLLAGMVFGISQ